jgi:hypothetical protein
VLQNPATVAVVNNDNMPPKPEIKAEVPISEPKIIEEKTIGVKIIEAKISEATNTPTVTVAVPEENRSAQNITVAKPPQEVLFIQQTNADFKINIQNLIPQIKNESIKSLLNEILAQILPQKDSDTLAFVKIDEKNPASSVKFLPLPLQTQFNSEFSAILSKSFPEFPKNLLLDTANIIRNSGKTISISKNLLEKIEIILKDPMFIRAKQTEQTNITPTDKTANDTVPTNNTTKTDTSPTNIQTPINTAAQTNTSANTTAAPQPQTDTQQKVNTQQAQINTQQAENTPPSQTNTILPQQIKITPQILANLLFFSAENNESVLQNLKAVFTSEKSISDISTQIKTFVESFENIEKNLQEKNPISKESIPISQGLTNAVEKLNNIENILKNAEAIFKKEDPIEYLMTKIGVFQSKTEEGKESKNEESLRTVLREISQHLKSSSEKLQNLPNLQSNEKLNETFSKLRNLSDSVNNLSQKIDGTSLLANRIDILTPRSEQTLLVPIQIGNAWIQMEFRVNKDSKNKSHKGKKQAEEVELNVELDKESRVSAKANLTLEKQLQVAINFTNDKMLEWFKLNYKEFCESLESIGTKSVRVIFNRQRSEEERSDRLETLKSNFEVVG